MSNLYVQQSECKSISNTKYVQIRSVMASANESLSIVIVLSTTTKY